MSSSDEQPKGPDLSTGVALDMLREGAPIVGHVGGEPAMLVRTGDEICGLAATCTHYGGPLGEGLVVDGTVRCPWHHACFDLRSGEAVGGPALTPLAIYAVHREGPLVRLGEKKAPPAKAAIGDDAPASVVIVGAGPAGAACAETLRREGYGGPITLLGTEAPVDRPNLSKDYLAGNAPEEWMPLRTAEFYEGERVDFRPGTCATRLDMERGQIELSDGPSLPYGAVLLATGAEPIRIPIPGAELPHVHVLRTLADARAIIAAQQAVRSVVVIGASFIGLEVAASLRKRGKEVTIVAPEAVPLARIFGDEVGQLVQRVHEEQGEVFRLGKKPARIEAATVVLDDGEALPAELVIMGVGVRPRLELASAAGLRVDRGVLVDASMRTSDPYVYAAGDIARFPLDGELVRIEHIAVAERQGRTAALSMLGRTPPVRDVPFFWSAHHDVTLSYVGHAERFDEIAVSGSLADRDATVGYLSDGTVRAVLTLNRDAASLAAERAFELGDRAALRALVGKPA